MDFIAIRSKLFLCATFSLTFAAFPAAIRAQSATASPAAAPTAVTKLDFPVKPQIDQQHPLYEFLEVAYKARWELQSIDDYSCNFMKREMLKGNKLLKTTMNLKLREKPFSVYLNFLDLNQGREVLYVNEKNNNMLLVHEGGIKSFLGTFELPINGPDAMAESRYPVTSIGLRVMIDIVIKQWEAEGKLEGITTKKSKEKLSTGEDCTTYEAIHQPHKDFKFHTTRLYIEDKSGLAIGLQQYSFPAKTDKEPPLAEEYFYGKLKTNLKMTDMDFDKKNPAYGFK